jgi:large subunit ribosomal protein L35
MYFHCEIDSRFNEIVKVEYSMPKLKTNRGAAKRFRATGNGFKHRGTARNHILTKKATKRKRQLRGVISVAKVDCPSITQMLPYA